MQPVTQRQVPIDGLRPRSTPGAQLSLRLHPASLSHCTLALLWQILRMIGGTGFPNQFFNDSWVDGFWRADHGGHGRACRAAKLDIKLAISVNIRFSPKSRANEVPMCGRVIQSSEPLRLAIVVASNMQRLASIMRNELAEWRFVIESRRSRGGMSDRIAISAIEGSAQKIVRSEQSEFAGEAKRNLVVVIVHRRTGVDADVEGLLPRHGQWHRLRDLSVGEWSS